MKIGLIGTGKMGLGIERLASEHGCEIVGKINSINQDWSLMQKADVWIDFSTAKALPNTVDQALQMKKPLLIGTTNWEKYLPCLKEKLASKPIGVLALPNCSMGLFIFLEALKKTASLLQKSTLPIEVKGQEIHHEEKKDAPSGTAKEILRQVKEKLKPASSFDCKREGKNPGFHELTFETPYETFTLSHQSHNRDGYLKGAFKAAFWLRDKIGFYTMEDYMSEVFCET